MTIDAKRRRRLEKSLDNINWEKVDEYEGFSDALNRMRKLIIEDQEEGRFIHYRIRPLNN